MLAAKTNKEKYGEDFYRNIGRKGGKRGHTGGFAANPALAKVAGAKGGRLGRRGPGNVVETKIEPRAEEIEKLYLEGKSIAQISRHIEVSYSTLLKWANRNLSVYGADDDIEGYEKILEHERGRDN